LGDEFYIGGLAAADTGTGELEQRLQDHRTLEGVRLQLGTVILGQAEEEVPVGPFLLFVGQVRGHVERLSFGVLLVADGTDLDTETAARAVVGRHLIGYV